MTRRRRVKCPSELVTLHATEVPITRAAFQFYSDEPIESVQVPEEAARSPNHTLPNDRVAQAHPGHTHDIFYCLKPSSVSFWNAFAKSSKNLSSLFA